MKSISRTTYSIFIGGIVTFIMSASISYGFFKEEDLRYHDVFIRGGVVFWLLALLAKTFVDEPNPNSRFIWNLKYYGWICFVICLALLIFTTFMTGNSHLAYVHSLGAAFLCGICFFVMWGCAMVTEFSIKWTLRLDECLQFVLFFLFWILPLHYWFSVRVWLS